MTLNMSYKDAHEEFVSNHTGSTYSNVAMCLLIIPFWIGVTKCWQSCGVPNFIVDVCLLVIPSILTLTLFAENGYWLLFTLLIFAVSVAIRRKSMIPAGPSSTVPSISSYKGANMLLTCISILAVDFAVFPRTLAKTETVGISVMDIGVGNFIVASALASKFARNKTGSNPWQYCVVLALGIGRMVVLKAINYHEHVSEYGEHWNFFVTLVAVWFVADQAHRLSLSNVAILATTTLIIYEILLQSTSLQSYLFSSTRISFVDSNKEGILSLFGYIPLYLITEVASRKIYFSDSARSRTVQLGVCWMISTGISATCIAAGSLPSRRIANLPYVALVLSLASFLLLVLHLIDQLIPSAVPYTLNILNMYQLQIFLAANVLTGAVNMVFQTIYMSDSIALLVIVMYSLAFVAVGHALDRYYASRKK